MALLETRPRQFSRTTTDSADESFANARFIGELAKDKTRLAVVSALTRADPVDNYRFRVKASIADKTVEFGLTGSFDSKQVRIQILEKNGKIIADSEAKFGDRKNNFEALQLSKLKLGTGEYILQVRRATGVLSREEPNYLIQMQSVGGKFREDYQTIERPQTRQLAAGVANTLSSADAANRMALQVANNATALQSLRRFNFINRQI